jgi:2'-5' RNA ligase
MLRNDRVPIRTALIGFLGALAGLAPIARAEERKPLRYFVGVELAPAPQEALAVLTGELQRLAPKAKLRWSPPPAYHLTLRFLGEQDEATLAAVAAALDVVAQDTRPLTTHLHGMGSFPWRGKGGPRVLWAGVAEPHSDLDDLAARIDEAVQAVGLPPADFPFRPHVTVARANRHAVAGELAEALENLEGADLGEWPIQAFVLYEARRPDPQGGYVEVRRYTLR